SLAFILLFPHPPTSTLFPYTTLFRSLIDASLDMWLTAGRFSREFEAELPKRFGRTTGALLVNSGSSANLVATSALGATRLALERSEEHTSELQSRGHLVCRLLLEKKN